MPEWRWTIRRWRSRKPKWGVEYLSRPRRRHSQLRLHVGRRRFTLMAVAHGSAASPRKDPSDG